MELAGRVVVVTGGADGHDAADVFADETAWEHVTPAFAADAVAHGIRAARLLILSHREPLTYVGRKASGCDRWLAGMRRAYSGANG